MSTSARPAPGAGAEPALPVRLRLPACLLPREGPAPTPHPTPARLPYFLCRWLRTYRSPGPPGSPTAQLAALEPRPHHWTKDTCVCDTWQETQASDFCCQPGGAVPASGSGQMAASRTLPYGQQVTRPALTLSPQAARSSHRNAVPVSRGTFPHSHWPAGHEEGCVPNCPSPALTVPDFYPESSKLQIRGHTGPTVSASPLVNQERLTEARRAVPRAGRCDPCAVAVYRGRAWPRGSGGALHCDTPGLQSAECKASMQASTRISAQL